MGEWLGGGPGLKMHRVLGGAIGGKRTGGPGHIVLGRAEGGKQTVDSGWKKGVGVMQMNGAGMGP